MEEEDFFTTQRERMVHEQLADRDIRDPRVLEAMREIPRHAFLAPEDRQFAYADGPIAIGSGQTISQPYIVALMTQLLELRGEETVLEVGTGSGYQAAILGRLARQVHSIERHPELARRAAEVLKSIGGLDNVEVHLGDGTQGLPEWAPYQAIIVTAAAPGVPPPLKEQLADEGCLVIPVGGRSGQTLERWVRRRDGFDRDEVVPVAFVPLLGRFGWDE